MDDFEGLYIFVCTGERQFFTHYHHHCLRKQPRSQVKWPQDGYCPGRRLASGCGRTCVLIIAISVSMDFIYAVPAMSSILRKSARSAGDIAAIPRKSARSAGDNA